MRISLGIIEGILKWALATRLAGHVKVPEEALKSIYQGATEKLEEIAKTKFQSHVKECTWNMIMSGSSIG